MAQALGIPSEHQVNSLSGSAYRGFLGRTGMSVLILPFPGFIISVVTSIRCKVNGNSTANRSRLPHHPAHKYPSAICVLNPRIACQWISIYLRKNYGDMWQFCPVASLPNLAGCYCSIYVFSVSQYGEFALGVVPVLFSVNFITPISSNFTLYTVCSALYNMRVSPQGTTPVARAVTATPRWDH